MIMTHVVNKLFNSQSRELMKALKLHRAHSVDVAATCRVLASAQIVSRRENLRTILFPANKGGHTLLIQLGPITIMRPKLNVVVITLLPDP